jgi:hypothetical protein
MIIPSGGHDIAALLVTQRRRSDPEFGTQNFTITNLILSEPDPHLYEFPEGYTVSMCASCKAASFTCR